MLRRSEARRQTQAVFLFPDEVSSLCRDFASTDTVMVQFRQLILAMNLLACPFSAFPQTHESQVQPISSALAARDYDKAVELSRAALQDSPGNAQLWTLQGIAFASKGDNKQALSAFQQALKISPTNIAALAGAAQVEYMAGSPGAVPLLNRLLQLRPGDPTGHAMLAVLEYRQGNCTGCRPQFPESRPTA